jgi:hypothetical protein
MTKTVSDKLTDHGISKQKKKVSNKQEGCVSLILRRKYLKVKNKQAVPVKHVLCLLDAFNVVWTMNLGVTKISVHRGYQRDYETKKKSILGKYTCKPLTYHKEFLLRDFSRRYQSTF